MLNPFKEVNWHPDLAGRRKFARSLLVGFPCAAVALLLIGRVSTGAWNFKLGLLIGGGGGLVGGLLLALPALARPVYLAWYGSACCIGLVVGNVLLGVLFYVLVTAVSLIMRALGRQPIQKRVDRQTASYWRDAEQPGTPDRYYRQF